MSVIVQICYGESAGVKGNWMNLIFFIYNRNNYSESIVGDIGFHNELSIGDPVHRMGAKINAFFKELKASWQEESNFHYQGTSF